MGISASKGVKVDDSAFQAHLRDYAKVMGKSMAEVIVEQAGLFCLDMVKYTRPFSSPGQGMTSESKAKGLENLKKSVYHIFQPIERATSQQIAGIGRMDVFKMWEKRNGETDGISGKSKKVRWRQFQQKYAGATAPQFIEAGDIGAMGALHTSLRQDNGRGSLTPTARHAKQPFAIVAKDRDIQRYIKSKQNDVGILKSGYWFAAQKIRSKANGPAWVKNSAGAGNAIGEDQTNQPLNPAVTVGNLKGGRGTFDSLIRSAINARAYAMRAVMAAKLNKEKVPLWVATAQGKTSGTSQFFS
jgi:hypothetical protein